MKRLICTLRSTPVYHLLDLNWQSFEPGRVVSDSCNSWSFFLEHLESTSVKFFADKFRTDFPQEASRVSCSNIGKVIYGMVKDNPFNEAQLVSLLTCFSMEAEIVSSGNYLDCIKEVSSALEREKETTDIFDFERSLQEKTDVGGFSLAEVDALFGEAFEFFVADLLNKSGYVCELTKATGDQGADIIANRNGTKMAVQAKRYAGSVSNSSIQEAIAGKGFYGCQKAAVITNSNFTKSAIELAAKTGVILWDRNYLHNKIREVC